MKSRFLYILLSIITLLGLVSCGESGSPSGSGKPSGSAPESLSENSSESSSESVRAPKGYYYTAILGDSITDKNVNKDIITTHYTDYLYENCSFIENIQNVGYGGSCIAGLSDKPEKMSPTFIERFRQIKSNVNLIIVFGGTNDYGIGSSTLPNPLGKFGDESPETFYGGLKTLIDGIERDYSAAKLVFVTPIYRREQELGGVPNENIYGFTLGDYASAIKETCEKRGVSCIDAFSELTEINAETCDDYELDGLHLNDQGNVLLGRFLAKKLAEILD